MITLNDITKKHFNERDVEVPSFVKFVNSSMPECNSLLDVGGHYSYATYAQSIKDILSTKQYDACDILNDPDTAKIVNKYMVGNVSELDLPKYDLVSCISVIEHCGITTYKKDDIEEEQNKIFQRMADLANQGLYLTFPYGLPGLFPEQYSNIHNSLLNKFCEYWQNTKGPTATINLQFFYNEFSPQGKPWIELEREVASLVPLRVDLGLVQCVCIFEARC